jgi:putative GTP pyrophosphokinase
MTKPSASYLRQRYGQLRVNLAELAFKLQEIVQRGVEDIEFIDSVAVRVKSRSSFMTKVLSDPERYSPPFTQVEDVIGARILVLFPTVAKDVFTHTTSRLFPPVESGYRQSSDPQVFGYEGFQSICSLPGELLANFEYGEDFPKVFELQIRTLFQHAALETEHELFYKHPPKLARQQEFQYKKRLAWIAADAWGADRVLGELHKVLIRSRKRDLTHPSQKHE